LAVHARHYRHGFEWFDNDIDEGTELLELLLAAAQCRTGPEPSAFAAAFRVHIDNDLDTPSAIGVLRDFAQGMLLVDDSAAAPSALRSAALLLGVDLPHSASVGEA
ncbi:MAG: hypothetical protein ACC652_15925, partial [Acidimicrobiales bacterium]